MKLPGALLGYAKEFAQSLIVFLIASYPAGAIKWLALDQEQSIEVQQRISKQNLTLKRYNFFVLLQGRFVPLLQGLFYLWKMFLVSFQSSKVVITFGVPGGKCFRKV
ncbi:MAG: hypothetical protein ACYSU5_13670 [Planctomycetota bacterium]|jgi:hypothetical protein